MSVERITDLTDAGTLDGTELLELSLLSTTVLISASTISAQASDQSYNDSGSGFVTAGFAVNDRVKVAGFATGANNISPATITALTAAKMTIGGAEGAAIVDEAAGASVTITKWITRRTTAQQIGDLGIANVPYFVPLGFGDSPGASQKLLIHTFPIAVDFADDWASSVSYVGTNPGAAWSADVQKNEVSIGSISVTTGGVVTFATTGGATSFAIGDRLEIIAPGTADGTIADCAFTLYGTRG